MFSSRLLLPLLLYWSSFGRCVGNSNIKWLYTDKLRMEGWLRHHIASVKGICFRLFSSPTFWGYRLWSQRHCENKSMYSMLSKLLWTFFFVSPFQDLLTSTSHQLYMTTSGRGHFSNVLILLPPSWAGSECVLARRQNNSNSSNSRSTSGIDTWFLTADFRSDFHVVGPHPVFGARQPWARQFGQCGAIDSGQGVQVPFTILTKEQKISDYSGKDYIFQI